MAVPGSDSAIKEVPLPGLETWHTIGGYPTPMDELVSHREYTFPWCCIAHLMGKYPSIASTFPRMYDILMAIEVKQVLILLLLHYFLNPFLFPFQRHVLSFTGAALRKRDMKVTSRHSSRLQGTTLMSNHSRHVDWIQAQYRIPILCYLFGMLASKSSTMPIS